MPEPSAAPVAPPAEPAKAAEVGGIDASGKQGVRGTVVSVAGDFMPPLPAGYEGTVKPIMTRVFIFRGVVSSSTPVDEQHPALVTTVKTDSAGRYSVSLLPATYTVVAEINGKLYLNRHDGSLNWATVKVAPSAFSDWKIADTSRATY